MTGSYSVLGYSVLAKIESLCWYSVTSVVKGGKTEESRRNQILELLRLSKMSVIVTWLAGLFQP